MIVMNPKFESHCFKEVTDLEKSCISSLSELSSNSENKLKMGMAEVQSLNRKKNNMDS